jgi:membrane protease YdiL (CAAX protease family)
MTKSARVDEVSLGQLALVEVGFVTVAVAIIHFRHTAGTVSLRMPLVVEAAIGLPIGAVLGAGVGVGLRSSPWHRQVINGVLPLRAITSTVPSIVLAGVLAGIGEELLFRAALQEWIGIGWASALFGLAHSGTARLHEGFSIGKIVYLLVTMVAGVLLGWCYQRVGLLASASAHAAFDVALLLLLAPGIAARFARLDLDWTRT